MHSMITMGHRNLIPNEQKMSTIDRELKVIELAAKKIKYVTNRMPVNAFTDHRPLTQVLKHDENNGRLARLIHRLKNRNTQVHYIKGSKNQFADTLSRLNPQYYNPRVNEFVTMTDEGTINQNVVDVTEVTEDVK